MSKTIARELVARGLLHAGDQVVFVSAHEDLRRAAAERLATEDRTGTGGSQ